MFEVVEVGSLTKKRLFAQRRRPVKLKCVSAAFCEMLTREFEGHGSYSNHKWRADFALGSVITIWLPATEMVAVGDMLGIENLSAQGRLGDFFRRVGISG